MRNIADHGAGDSNLLVGLTMHEDEVVAIVKQEAALGFLEDYALYRLEERNRSFSLVPSRMSRSSIWAKAPPLPGFTCSTFTAVTGARYVRSHCRV